MQQQREQESANAEQILPPDASRSGVNTVYVPCAIRNARQHYGVCLNIIKANNEDRLSESCKDCARAILHGNCPSDKMRQEELKAGKALYFVPRVERVAKTSNDDGVTTAVNVDRSSESYQRGWNAVGKKSKPVPIRPALKGSTKRAKSQPAVEKDDFKRGLSSNASMTDVVNDMVSQENAKHKSAGAKPGNPQKSNGKSAQRTHASERDSDESLGNTENVGQREIGDRSRASGSDSKSRDRANESQPAGQDDDNERVDSFSAAGVDKLRGNEAVSERPAEKTQAGRLDDRAEKARKMAMMMRKNNKKKA